MNPIKFIDKIKEMYNDQDPRYAKAEFSPVFDPDLEQSEFLRPGETLEDWKPNPFLKPHAEGGRAGYNEGQLVRNTVDGSRPGYDGRPSKKGSNFYYKQSTNEWIVYSRKPGDLSEKKYVHPFKKKSDALEFLEKGKESRLKSFKKTREFRTKEVNKAYDDINSWTKKWLNKNMPEYTAKEFPKLEKDFAEAWAKELKTNSSLYPMEGIKGMKFDVSTKTNLPWARELKLSGLTSPRDKTSDTFFKKVFYKEKLKNPELKKQVKSYLEWVVADKKLKTTKLKYKGLETPGTAAGRLKHLETAKINQFDEDVIHLISEMQKGDPSGIYLSLKEQFPDLLKKYSYKVSTGASQWRENLRIVAKNAGLDPDLLLKQMKNENVKVAKILGISVDKVPDELRYAMDHVAGLAEAANYTGANKAAFSRKTLNTFTARTMEQNKKLGRQTLSIPRSKLIRKFNEAKTLDAKATIVEDINKLVEKHIPGELKYKVTQSGNLDFKALAPQKTFKSRVSSYQSIPEVNKFLKEVASKDSKAAQRVITQLNSGIPINQIMEELARVPGMKKLARGFMKVGGPWEVGFAVVDFINNLDSMDPDEAFKTTMSDVTFGLYKGGQREAMETLNDAAAEIGHSNKGFNSYKEIIDLNKLLESEKEKLKKLNAKKGKFPDEEIDWMIKSSEEFIPRLQKEIDSKVENFIQDEDYENIIKSYDQTVNYVARKQYDKNVKRKGIGKMFFGDKKRRVNPDMNVFGSPLWQVITDWKDYVPQSILPQNFLQNYLTKAIPNTLRKLPGVLGDVWEPTSERAKLYDMSEEEIDQRAKDLNIQGNTMNAQQMESYYDKYYASGGRAGYMGGGIAGIRKPNAIPPERQGLRSIMINGKKS